MKSGKDEKSDRLQRTVSRKGQKRMEQEKKEAYMRLALEEAKKAYELLEVPIGCVIVYEDKVIGKGYNRRNTDKTTLAHAEIEAISQASAYMGDWRLEGCSMFVTLEPCQMCAGAIVQTRMDAVYIGCMNAKAGCAGSIYNLLQEPAFNHQVELEKGILEAECSSMLKVFFRGLRMRNQLEKYRKKTLPRHQRIKRCRRRKKAMLKNK